MALSELDRLTQAVKAKRQATLGDIEDAAGISQPTQVADASIAGAASAIKNRGSAMDKTIDAAVKGNVAPAKPAAPAAPAEEPDDSAIGIHIPKPAKPAAPSAKPGFFKRMLGDSGDAGEVGTAALAATAAAPGVKEGFVRMADGTISTAADAARVGASPSAAVPNVEVPPAGSAAQTTRLGQVAQGAKNIGGKALNVGSKLLKGVGVAGAAVGGYQAGSAFYDNAIANNTDVADKIGGTINTALNTVGLGVDDTKYLQAKNDPRLKDVTPAGPAAAASPDLLVRAADSNAGPPATPGLGAPVPTPSFAQTADQRAALVQSPTANARAGFVNLGDQGYPGAQVAGRATGGNAKLNDFVGEGNGASAVKNGVNFGITPEIVAADRAERARKASLGDLPSAPRLEQSKETLAALKDMQTLAAKLKDPLLSRKERKQLQAQIAVAHANAQILGAQDLHAYGAQDSAYKAALGQYQHNTTNQLQRDQLDRQSTVDALNAEATLAKGRYDMSKDAKDAARVADATAYQRKQDNDKHIDGLIDTAVGGGFGGVAPGDKRTADLMKTAARTIPLDIKGPDGKTKRVTFADLDPNDRTAQLPALIAAVRSNIADTNGRGMFTNPISVTGQNPALGEATFDQKLNYIAGGPSLGRVGEAFNPLTPKLFTGGDGRFVPGEQLTKEEIEAMQKKKRKGDR
jgi:hypothetical protein